MSRFFQSLLASIVVVPLSFLVLALVVNPPSWDVTVPRIELPSGHAVSYIVRGDPNRTNCIIWLHGVLSSRYESLLVGEDLLEELDAFVVSFDRPGYGESDPHVGRDFASNNDDILAVADSMGAKRFFLLGVSAGGAYSWAAASMIPERIRGILLISSAGPHDLIKSEISDREFADTSSVQHFVRKLLDYPVALRFVHWASQTHAIGRLLYQHWLGDLAQNVVTRMAEVDAKCARRDGKYSLKIIPESVKQATATPVIVDLIIISKSWKFSLKDISPPLAAAIHIWHGTGDLQVPHEYGLAFKREVPAAHLNVIDGGGHFAYFMCNATRQREALSQLIEKGLPAS